MNFQMEPSGESGTLTIDEPLTIENVSGLKALFLDAYKQANHLTIRFNSLPDIDLTGLQLFCSAHRTFSEGNKEMTVDFTHADIFKKQAKKIGLIRHRGCDLERSNNCLWRKP